MYHTATLERLAEVKDRCGAIGPFSDDLEQAFEFLMSLRVRHQYRQLQAGSELDNFIDPKRLGALERATLKESFRLILSMQETLAKKYGPWMAM